MLLFTNISPLGVRSLQFSNSLVERKKKAIQRSAVGLFKMHLLCGWWMRVGWEEGEAVVSHPDYVPKPCCRCGEAGLRGKRTEALRMGCWASSAHAWAHSPVAPNHRHAGSCSLQSRVSGLLVAAGMCSCSQLRHVELMKIQIIPTLERRKFFRWWSRCSQRYWAARHHRWLLLHSAGGRGEMPQSLWCCWHTPPRQHLCPRQSGAASLLGTVTLVLYRDRHRATCYSSGCPHPLLGLTWLYLILVCN